MTATAADLALALEMCEAADAITLARFGAEDLEVTAKPDLTPVSEADTAAERTIRARLAAARPGDAVVGEEYGTEGAEGARRRWIIDPIDGTKNYVRGVPVWATLLALEEDGEGTVAVVSAPALGRRWWAARGQGAWGHDGPTGRTRRLTVSMVSELSAAHISTPGFEGYPPGASREALLALIDRAGRSRGFGDFWSYMLLAEGALEVATDPEATLWDLLAVQVVVEEAGGRFSDLSGRRTADGGNAVATNGLLHDAVLALIGSR